MKFQDLTLTAQNAALEDLREMLVEYEWWEYSYEYFKEICASFGLVIYNMTFSGFSCQGDGASFEGEYEWWEPDFSKIPEDIAPALRVLKEQSALIRTYDPDTKLTVKVARYGNLRHHHEYSMQYSIFIHNAESEEDEHSAFTLLDEEAIADAFRDIARWMYSYLEDEYEYLTSDEAIKETIDANDFRFTEDGELA